MAKPPMKALIKAEMAGLPIHRLSINLLMSEARERRANINIENSEENDCLISDVTCN